MNDEEIKKKKKELMMPAWTEDLHHELEELAPEDSKKIVESMSNTEIYTKVNNRKFQQDYIADYLMYLWEISESAFWKHIKSTLNIEIGLLWGTDMLHFEKMCDVKIPDDVLIAVLNFAVNCDKECEQDFEAIGCVIKAQVDDFNRLTEIKEYIAKLALEKQKDANERIIKMINSQCNYTFY